MISLYTHVAYWSWFVLFVVWLIGYFGNKHTLRRPDTGRFLGTTALLIVSYSLLFGTWYPNWLGLPLTPQTAVLGILGNVLCIGGILFAIWARVTLGSNWSGSVATLKQDHELIQRGPYAFVRHPIYTGFFLAMIGTALTVGLRASYIGVLLGSTAFLMRIPVEERLMTEQFPDTYPAYKTRVKGLIPFVW
jgi:protein-S-isoprenylcysteine O-methyltransferase Ste14